MVAIALLSSLLSVLLLMGTLRVRPGARRLRAPLCPTLNTGAVNGPR
jgi:hypothetical protein